MSHAYSKMLRDKESEIPVKRQKSDDMHVKRFAEVVNHQREWVTSNQMNSSSSSSGANSGRWSESAERRMALFHAITSGQTDIWKEKHDKESEPKTKPRRSKAAMIFNKNTVVVPPCKPLTRPITIEDPPSDSELSFSRTKDCLSSQPKWGRTVCRQQNAKDFTKTTVKSSRSAVDSRIDFLKSLYELTVDSSSEEDTASTPSLSIEGRCIKSSVQSKEDSTINERVCSPELVKCNEEYIIGKRVCSPEVVLISDEDDLSTQVSNVISNVCGPEVVISDNDVSTQVSEVTSTVCSPSGEVTVIISDDDSQSCCTDVIELEESSTFSQSENGKSKFKQVQYSDEHSYNIQVQYSDEPHTTFEPVICVNEEEESSLPNCAAQIPQVLDQITRSCLSSEITSDVEDGLEMLYTLISSESKLSDKFTIKLLEMLLETTNVIVAKACYDVVIKQYAFHSWDDTVDLWRFLEMAVKQSTDVYCDPTPQSSSKQLCSFLVTVLEENFSRTKDGPKSSSLAKKILNVSGQFYKVKVIVNGIKAMCNQNKLQGWDCGHHLFRLLKLIALVNNSLHVGRRIAEEVYPAIVNRTSTSRLRKSIVNMMEPPNVKMYLLTLIIAKDENACNIYDFHKKNLSMEFCCDNLAHLFRHLDPLKSLPLESLQCDLSEESSGNTEEQSYDELIFILSSMLETFIAMVATDAVERPAIDIDSLQIISSSVHSFCKRMTFAYPSFSNSRHLKDLEFLAVSLII